MLKMVVPYIPYYKMYNHLMTDIYKMVDLGLLFLVVWQKFAELKEAESSLLKERIHLKKVKQPKHLITELNLSFFDVGLS